MSPLALTVSVTYQTTGSGGQLVCILVDILVMIKGEAGIRLPLPLALTGWCTEVNRIYIILVNQSKLLDECVN